MALNIQWIGSPNKMTGRNGFRPEAVVIHIMEGTLVGTDAWFKNPASKVSAHYGIGKSGEIHQYVHEANSAFHAGRKKNSTWQLLKPGVNPNYYTIGIEHEGKIDSAWTTAMYEASTALVREICNRWSTPIDRDHIIGHREIYGVKECPGRVVDLDKLVSMAKESALDTVNYNLIVQSGSVTTRTDLNIRKGAPTAAAEKVKTVSTGTVLSYTGWTSNGQMVNGNAHWYRDADGNFFWAGGTDKPVPGL